MIYLFRHKLTWFMKTCCNGFTLWSVLLIWFGFLPRFLVPFINPSLWPTASDTASLAGARTKSTRSGADLTWTWACCRAYVVHHWTRGVGSPDTLWHALLNEVSVVAVRTCQCCRVIEPSVLVICSQIEQPRPRIHLAISQMRQYIERTSVR